MPIITPTYPSFCTTHNVTRSALEVINEEFERGHQLTEMMVIGKRPWRELFEKHNFFTGAFKYYLTITSISKSKEAHKAWSGYIESRSRHLAIDLDNHGSISLARPYIKAFDRVHRCKTQEEMEEVENGSLKYVVKEEDLAPGDQSEKRDKDEVEKAEMSSKDDANGAVKDEESSGDTGAGDAPAENGEAATNGQQEHSNGTDSSVKKEKEEEEEGKTTAAEDQDPKTLEQDQDKLIYTTTQFIGLTLQEGTKSINLSLQCDRFTNDCKQSDKFDDKIHNIRIQNIKASSLPDDVFAPGEQRPQPAKKRKRPMPTSEGNGAGGGGAPAMPNMPAPKRQQTAAATAG